MVNNEASAMDFTEGSTAGRNIEASAQSVTEGPGGHFNPGIVPDLPEHATSPAAREILLAQTQQVAQVNSTENEVLIDGVATSPRILVDDLEATGALADTSLDNGQVEQASQLIIIPPDAVIPDTGEFVMVDVAPGADVQLNSPLFDPSVASYSVDGTDLVIILESGGVLTLRNFFLAGNGPPATLALLDGNAIEATDLLARAEYSPALDEIEPAVGGESDGIAGGENGNSIGGGADFTEYDPGNIGAGPNVTGPLGPTSLFTTVTFGDDDTLDLIGDGDGDDGGPGDGGIGGPGDGGGIDGPGDGGGGTDGPGDGGGGTDGPGDGGGPIPSAGSAPVLTLREDVTAGIGELSKGVNPPSTERLPNIGPDEVVPDDEINGVSQDLLTGNGRNEVFVTFESETSRSIDTLLYHEIDENGNLTNLRVVFATANMPGDPDSDGPSIAIGTEVSLGIIPEGTQFGLVLVNDGHPSLTDLLGSGRIELRNADGGIANINDGQTPHLVHVSDSGEVTFIDERLYFTADPTAESGNDNPLNPDGLGHVVSGFDAASGSTIIAFEDGGKVINPDRFNVGRDNDFDDAVFSIRFDSRVERTLFEFDFDGGLLAAITDEDSDTLTSSVVRLEEGQDGDRLSIDEAVLDGTGIVISSISDNEISFEGASSIQNYQSVISAVRLEIDPDTGDAGTRTISATVTDDTGLTSDPATVNINVNDDVISGTSADDNLVGTSSDGHPVGGNDIISGLGGDDFIKGRSGDDFIDGGSGDDNIRGGPGDDFINGGAGFDTIRPGTGADTISYTALSDGRDKIIGFNVNEGDRLDLECLLDGSSTDTNGDSLSDVINAEFRDLDGDGSADDIRLTVDLDGDGSEHVPQHIVSFIDPVGVSSASDILNAIDAGSHGGTES